MLKISSYPQNETPLGDMRNIELLRILSDDPRISVSELARQVGMSPPAVRERLVRLHETGVIRGYRIDIDPVAVGLPITAFIRVRPAQGQSKKVAELVQTMPEVSECHRVTGEDCYILKVHLTSIADDLDRVIDQLIVYGQTTTSIVQSTPVPPRQLPLPVRASSYD
jgi:Lrp/AsnC family transcriptional regulator, leucine-responsive regulatory protein